MLFRVGDAQGKRSGQRSFELNRLQLGSAGGPEANRRGGQKSVGDAPSWRLGQQCCASRSRNGPGFLPKFSAQPGNGLARDEKLAFWAGDGSAQRRMIELCNVQVEMDEGDGVEQILGLGCDRLEIRQRAPLG